MFEKEEKELNKMRQYMDEQDISDKISQHIHIGMIKGQKQRKKVKRKAWTSVTVSFLIVMMIFSIRVSPVFASYVSKIPGMDIIVKMINYDKGLTLAVKNDFIQHIGISDEHDLIQLTVDGIIVDEQRMVIFYTLEDRGNHGLLDVSGVKLLDENGKHLPAGYSYGSFFNKKEDVIHDKIVVSFQNGMEIPNSITMEMKLSEKPNEDAVKIGITSSDEHPVKAGASPTYLPVKPDPLGPTWRIKIPIDKSRFENMKEVYTLNQTVDIEGQKIYFDTLTLNPTTIAIEVRYDKNNSKQIFSFDDLRVVDKHGEEFAAINNGVISTNIDDNTRIFYLQSNYFKKPEKLFLKANKIRALDKDKLEVVVDLKQNKLFKKPDNRIKLVRTEKDDDGKSMNLVFALKKDDSFHAFVFNGTYQDANGKEYKSTFNGKRSGSDLKNYNEELYYEIKDIDYQGPITLHIDSYPTTINGNIDIQVK